jgi:hypothetical protein
LVVTSSDETAWQDVRSDLALAIAPKLAGFDPASLIAVGGLIETMSVWLDGGLDSTAEQIIDDYTRLCAAALSAAVGAWRLSALGVVVQRAPE